MHTLKHNKWQVLVRSMLWNGKTESAHYVTFPWTFIIFMGCFGCRRGAYVSVRKWLELIIHRQTRIALSTANTSLFQLISGYLKCQANFKLRIYLANLFPSTIVHINPDSQRTKTTSSKRTNCFCELEGVFSDHAVSMKFLMQYFSKCTWKMLYGNTGTDRHTWICLSFFLDQSLYMDPHQMLQSLFIQPSLVEICSAFFV